MLKLKISKSFNSILPAWTHLYAQTAEVSPFLHPEAMAIAVKYFYPYYLTKRCRPIFLVFYEEDSIRAIAPMLKYSDGKLQLFGFANGFNESGILFDSEEILPECFIILKELSSDVEFLKIDERSPIAKYAPANRTLTSNAEIQFCNDFDEYFKSLSKSVRQNIRTAFNRLQADGLNYELKIFHGNDTALPIDEIIKLYCIRHEMRYGVKTSFFKKWLLKSQSFATRFYRQSSNAMTFVLYINDNPAAFLSGLSVNNRLIVPRLSIDETYKRYSPGMLLVVEVIKYLINHTNISVLDLSQGNESYKYNLGAKEHFSYRYRL